MADASSQDSSDHDFSGTFIDKHLALVSAVSLVLIATLKVYFVSSFNLSTALTVLSIVDRTQLLTASALTGLVLLVPVSFIQPTVHAFLNQGHQEGATFLVQLRTAVIWWLLVFIFIFSSTLVHLAACVLIWIFIWFRNRKVRNKVNANAVHQYHSVAGQSKHFNTNWLIPAVLG